MDNAEYTLAPENLCHRYAPEHNYILLIFFWEEKSREFAFPKIGKRIGERIGKRARAAPCCAAARPGRR